MAGWPQTNCEFIQILFADCFYCLRTDNIKDSFQIRSGVRLGTGCSEQPNEKLIVNERRYFRKRITVQFILFQKFQRSSNRKNM